MRTPEIYGRREDDIKNLIRKIAAAYTPEWRFDANNPDVGTALALIYTDMFSETIKRFNMTPDKHKIAFFNGIGAKLLPAIPAAGYVTFSLAGDRGGGAAVKSRTQLTADTEDDELKNIIFETTQDVFVTPAELERIFCVSGRHDIISKIYDIRNEDDENKAPYYLFDLNGSNSQEHILCFGETFALQINGGAWVEVELLSHHESRLDEELLQRILDEKNALWEYGSHEGFLPFDGAAVQNGKLLFFKSERQPGFALTPDREMESRWIRCTVKNIEVFEELYLNGIRISSQSQGILPDAINSAGADENKYACFPFGEKMSLFSDVYFASEEAMSKKGAKVKLSFNMNFVRIPIDLEIGDPNINWKLIMKRSDFKPDVEYDITIEDVVWEYYNGWGWARLFPENEYRDVFTTKMGTMGQYRSIDFICPHDIEKIVIQSCESYFIRCRILKLNNLYKIKGNYVSPYIEGPNFSYKYEHGGVLPDALYTINNLQEEIFHKADLNITGGFLQPFKCIPEKQTALYLGISRPLKDGPLKLLFALEDSVVDSAPRLIWEYYGSQGWTPLNVADETGQLRKSGIVTFMGCPDFRLLKLWNEECYWIRIVDTSEAYNDRRNPLQLSRVRSIAFNATQAIQTESRAEELFFVEHFTDNLVCQLLHPSVQDLEVWVDESEQGAQEEWEALQNQGKLQVQLDALGEQKKVWVKWTEVEDLALSGPEDRHYVIDRNIGAIEFGNGKNGQIPPAYEWESIRVVYRTGGGEAGNLPVNAINKINVSIGFINGVQNPEVTSGGCDRETIREAMMRTAASLKHGYRGVTASDYEALAMEASRNIWKTKCFSNYNDKGEREPGTVTLVVLQKDFQQGRNYFGRLQEQVYRYISARISGNMADLRRFHVIEPQFLELSVKVELTVADFNLIFQVKEAVEERLAGFIHPMTGNFDGRGWGIGTIPNQTQIMNGLKGIEGVSFLKSVFVTAFREGRQGKTEADPEQSGELVFCLPLSGKHEILISVDERR